MRHSDGRGHLPLLLGVGYSWIDDSLPSWQHVPDKPRWSQRRLEQATWWEDCSRGCSSSLPTGRRRPWGGGDHRGRPPPLFMEF